MCRFVEPPENALIYGFRLRVRGEAAAEEELGELPEVEEALAVIMLRARPTQITLNSRDIDWHHVRHENRQGQRARGQPVHITATQLSDSPSPPPLDEEPLPFRFPRPPAQLPPVRGLQLPTFTTEQDMHEYWSRITANAADLPQVHSVSSGRPVMINTSPSSHSAIEASTASFDSDDVSIQEFDDQENDDADSVSLSYESGHVDPEEESKMSSGTHLPIRSAGENDHNNEERDDHSDPMVVQSPHITRRHRLSFSFLRRRAHGPDTLEHINSVHRQTENAEFDGSSDRHPTHHTYESAHSATESQYATAPSSLHDDAPRTQECSADSSASAQDDLEVRHISEMLEFSSPFKDAPDLATSKSPPLPRQLGKLQRLSGLPRSPLHISEVAASSSSEKRPRPTEDAIELSESLEGLSLHPRRAKRYKRRSQSYPYIQSEAEANNHSSQQEGSSQDIYHSTLSELPTLQLPAPADNLRNQSSPKSSNTSLHPGSDASSEKPFTGPLTRRSLSPLAPPFTPRRSPIQPPLALPSHPFSAVRRTVSFASPSPSSSPSPSRVQFQTPPYSFNNLPIGPLRTPPPPRTPQYIVYNDRLPASIQPQTPLGLPSNGIPSGGLPGVNYGAAYTAPAGGELFGIFTALLRLERTITDFKTPIRTETLAGGITRWRKPGASNADQERKGRRRAGECAARA